MYIISLYRGIKETVALRFVWGKTQEKNKQNKNKQKEICRYAFVFILLMILPVAPPPAPPPPPPICWLILPPKSTNHYKFKIEWGKTQ